MRTRTTRRARLAVIATVLLAGSALAGTALAGNGDAKASGPLTVYATSGPNPLAGASAKVHEVTTGNGRTKVMLHVSGLDRSLAGRTFGAHVHVNACGDGSDGMAAGPHYTHPAAAPTLENREIWLDFAPNRGGNGHSKATRSWTFTVPTGARSVVIHANPTAPDGTAGARLACLDVPFTS